MGFLIHVSWELCSKGMQCGGNIGNILKRAKSLIPVLIPLFISSFRRADELATAMECRCYHGGEGRTRMKQLKTTTTDYLAVGYTMVFLAGIILVNIYF